MSRSVLQVLVCSSVAVCASGCQQLLQFDVEQALPEQRVAGSALGGILPAFLPSPLKVTVDVKAETAARNTGPASRLFLKELTLRVTPADAPAGTFDFLDEVHLFVATPSNAAPKVEVAALKPVPRGATRLTFTVVPNVNLLPYVNGGAELTATATGTQPRADVTFDGKLVLDVRI